VEVAEAELIVTDVEHGPVEPRVQMLAHGLSGRVQSSWASTLRRAPSRRCTARTRSGESAVHFSSSRAERFVAFRFSPRFRRSRSPMALSWACETVTRPDAQLDADAPSLDLPLDYE